jgi:rhodanese-related sulfurtransferase
MDFTDRIELDVTELKALIESGADLQLLDVREDWEHGVCLIPASIKMPMGQVPARAGELDRARPVVAICHHGARSLRVTNWLRQQGFAQAINLKGGVDSWARNVDPAMARY